MNGKALLSAYLAHLAHERRLSAHTLDGYGRDISALLQRAGATPLADLHAHDIRRFIGHFHSKGLGARSIARMLAAWRAIAGDDGWPDENKPWHQRQGFFLLPDGGCETGRK